MRHLMTLCNNNTVLTPPPPHCLLQRTCRRLLAFYDLPSWGRSCLALSLLTDEGAEHTLEDVVALVKESMDREFIVRNLSTNCLACFCAFPRRKVGDIVYMVKCVLDGWFKQPQLAQFTLTLGHTCGALTNRCIRG